MVFNDVVPRMREMEGAEGGPEGRYADGHPQGASRRKRTTRQATSLVTWASISTTCTRSARPAPVSLPWPMGQPTRSRRATTSAY